MDISEVHTAPHSPWQNAFAERWIGSLRRECLDHEIVLAEKTPARDSARRHFEYYQESRTHLSLGKDAPSTRAAPPPELGSLWRFRKLVADIIATNVVLHNRNGIERAVSPRTVSRARAAGKPFAECEAFVRPTTAPNRKPGSEERRPLGRKRCFERIAFITAFWRRTGTRF
jgi:hypothetical protein